MSYKDDINQTQTPLFVELYDIVFPNFTLYLTPYISNITYGTTTYISTVLERSDFTKEKGEIRNVTITLATKEDASLQFLEYDVPKIRVTIRRYFPASNTIRVLLVGEGYIVGISDRVVTFQVRDILNLEEIVIPNVVYSPYCCNTLYDSRCGLNRYAYQVLTKITAVSSNGKILQSASFSVGSENYFQYGYVEWNKNYRLITASSSSSSNITLHVAFDGDVVGQIVSVYTGCDKTPQTCQSKFNNLSNYLGFPYIPTKNPVIWGFK